jgi:hypothetical protein
MFSAFNGEIHEMSMGCGISTETYGAQGDSVGMDIRPRRLALSRPVAGKESLGLDEKAG